MKSIRLICQFYHKSKFLLLLLTVILTVSCFFLLYTAGTVKYLRYTRDMFSDFLPNNSFCINYGTTLEYGGDMELYIEEQHALIKSLKANPLIKEIAYMRHTGTLKYNEENVTVFLYNDILWERLFSFQTADISSLENKSGAIPCITACSHFKEAEDSQSILLRAEYDVSGKNPLMFQIASHVPYPYYIPAFLTAGTMQSTDEFFSSGQYVVIRETEENLSKLKGITPIYPCVSLFITFHEHAPQGDIEAFLQDLRNTYSIESAASIYENTEKSIASRRLKLLPMPVFLLVVSSAAFLSLSVLLLHKKEKEHAIYYLCGYSRRKVFLMSLCALGIPAFAAAILNSIFLLHYSSVQNIFKFNDTLLNIAFIKIVLIYLVSMLCICVLLPLIRLRNKSEIEIFRRN